MGGKAASVAPKAVVNESEDDDKPYLQVQNTGDIGQIKRVFDESVVVVRNLHFTPSQASTSHAKRSKRNKPPDQKTSYFFQTIIARRPTPKRNVTTTKLNPLRGTPSPIPAPAHLPTLPSTAITPTPRCHAQRIPLPPPPSLPPSSS